MGNAGRISAKQIDFIEMPAWKSLRKRGEGWAMDMSGPEFIDCSCMIGKRTSFPFFGPGDTARIKSVLVKSGVKKALVYHSLSIEYHPVEGNNKLLEEIAGDSFFIPVFVAMPDHTGEFPSWGDLKGQIAKNGIKALRLAPAAAGLNYSLAEWSLGKTYGLAQELKLPLMIDGDQIGWDDLYGLLARHEGMNVILTKVGYRSARYLYPILNDCRNLYIDISMYKNHMGIEHLCGHFGSGRLLYGSAMPMYSPGCAKAMVLNAAITDADKRNIAGDNIMRLIGEAG